MKRLKSLLIFLVIVGGLFWFGDLVLAVEFSGDGCLELLGELELGIKEGVHRPMGRVVSEDGGMITCELGYSPDKKILKDLESPTELLFWNLSSGVWHGNLPEAEKEYLSRCIDGQMQERIYYSDVNWRGRQTVTVELSTADEIFSTTGSCSDWENPFANTGVSVAPPPNDSYCYNEKIVAAYFNYDDISKADERLLARMKAGEYSADNLRIELFKAQDILYQAHECTLKCNCIKDPYLLMDAYNKWVSEVGAAKFGVGAIVIPTPSYDLEFEYEAEIRENEEAREEEKAVAIKAVEYAKALVENPPTPKDLILIPGVSSTVEFQKGFGVEAVKGEVKVLWPSGGDFRTPREGDVIQEGTQVKIERGSRILLKKKGYNIIVEGPITFKVEWGAEDLGEDWNEHFEIIEGSGRIKFDYMDEKGFIEVGEKIFLMVDGKLIKLQGTDLGVSYDPEIDESVIELYDGKISIDDEVVLETKYGEEIKRVEVDKDGKMVEKIGIPQDEWEAFEKKMGVNQVVGMIGGMVLTVAVVGLLWWLKKRKKK